MDEQGREVEAETCDCWRSLGPHPNALPRSGATPPTLIRARQPTPDAARSADSGWGAGNVYELEAAAADRSIASGGGGR